MATAIVAAATMMTGETLRAGERNSAKEQQQRQFLHDPFLVVKRDIARRVAAHWCALRPA
jgi:hypothetical protein